MQTPIEKLAQIINNGLIQLSQKIDDLVTQLKKQKPSASPSPQVKVNIPDIVIPPIEIPPATINIPEIDTTKIEKAIREGLGNNKYPVVNVPKPDPVVVNVEPTPVTVTPTPVEFPKEMEVKKMDELIAKIVELINQEVKNPIAEINSKKPMAVMVVNKDGKQISDFGGEFSAPNVVGLRIGTTVLSASHPLPVAMGFQIPVYDTEVIDASLAPTTTVITYKKSGATVATKTITVSGTTTTITVA